MRNKARYDEWYEIRMDILAAFVSESQQLVPFQFQAMIYNTNIFMFFIQ